jgi:DNA-binding transcriptional LysR family regulator
MDVHRLRVLRAVVAHGSVHGAATSLGYSPSAISQHLNALQREIGLTLVQRSGRGIEATEAGRTLATEASRLFDRLADLDSLAADLRTGRVGALTISYFASAGAAWIPPVVATISREFPQLRLDLRLTELTSADATEPDVEIAVEGSRSSNQVGYQVRFLLTEPYFAVVPSTSAMARKGQVQLGDLRHEPWVDNDMARGPCRQTILDACATVGFSPAFRVEAQDYPTAIRFVAEGMGITVVPRLGLASLPRSAVALRIVNPTPRRTICVWVRNSCSNHPAVIRMLELLDERVAAARSSSAENNSVVERESVFGSTGAVPVP